MWVSCIFVPLTVLVIFTCSLSGHVSESRNTNPFILEDTINASVECVRGVLNDGLPEFGLPSFNPLILDDIFLDFDSLNLTNISGQISIKNGIATDIASFVMTKIIGDLILIPPTYTVNFALHYDVVNASGDYMANMTLWGVPIWGQGQLISGVQNLDAAGHVKAIVDLDGVHVLEFNAPITLEAYVFKITGLFGDEAFSELLSQQISDFIPPFVNGHPEIFSDIIAPILIDIFNGLMNDQLGIGIVKTIVQRCILDILFPPGTTTAVTP